MKPPHDWHRSGSTIGSKGVRVTAEAAEAAEGVRSLGTQPLGLHQSRGWPSRMSFACTGAHKLQDLGGGFQQFIFLRATDHHQQTYSGAAKAVGHEQAACLRRRAGFLEGQLPGQRCRARKASAQESLQSQTKLPPWPLHQGAIKPRQSVWPRKLFVLQAPFHFWAREFGCQQTGATWLRARRLASGIQSAVRSSPAWW